MLEDLNILSVPGLVDIVCLNPEKSLILSLDNIKVVDESLGVIRGHFQVAIGLLKIDSGTSGSDVNHTTVVEDIASYYTRLLHEVVISFFLSEIIRVAGRDTNCCAEDESDHPYCFCNVFFHCLIVFFIITHLYFLKYVERNKVSLEKETISGIFR